jgi:hypothetical protein
MMIQHTGQWLFGAAVGFVAIGLDEALIKPIAKKFFKRRLLKYAPIAMQLLDEQMLGLLAHGSGSRIETLLTERLESLTGESWKKSEINELFSLYDPRITADRVSSSNDQANSDK